MGRGKSWSRDESEAVAKAWKRASQGKSSTREQNNKNIVGELYQRFIELAPQNAENIDGRWSSRSQTAVKTQFDAIGDDVSKFNSVLADVVEQAVSRGLTISEDILLRAAIGVHLGVIAGDVNFNAVDSVENDWKLFGAWCILKTCQKFAPVNWPVMRTPIPGQDEDDGENSDDGPSSQVPQPSSMENGNGNFNIASPRELHSGGTPMRTLATAALSMNLGPGGMPSLTPMAQKLLNRQEEDLDNLKDRIDDEDRRNNNKHRKRKAENSNTGGGPAAKQAKSMEVADMLPSNSIALERIGEALCALGDALSEYNAIALFSRADMQGRSDQKVFFDTMAEKHVLKAKLDRDKLVKEVRKRGKRIEGSEHESR